MWRAQPLTQSFLKTVPDQVLEHNFSFVRNDKRRDKNKDRQLDYVCQFEVTQQFVLLIL